MPGACMHLIPQSASHWHLLVSIFPSIGLIFVLGFYVTALVTNDAATKRICLLLFVILGLLTIPTYLSGDRSMALLSRDPKISKDLMSAHFGWGVTSLALLALTGAAALIELWRSRHAERLSNDALHLVLGLAIVSLILMAITGEIGWEINHHELRLDAAPERTPQAWSHIHIILNHFPTLGFVLALVLLRCRAPHEEYGHDASEPGRFCHMRHLGCSDLCHRRCFDVGADRDSGDFPGCHQRSPRYGAVEPLRACVHR